MKATAQLIRRLIEVISVSLLILLAVIVIAAVFFRYVLNDSLVWYDEVASVLLAWVTYFGAALATFKRAHMGFGAVLNGLPLGFRLPAFAIAEAVVYAVFIILAWAGWRVLAVMDGMNLEALPWIPLQFVQAIIPLGCALAVLAQISSTPLALEHVLSGRDADADEIDAEVERSKAGLERARCEEVKR